MPIPNAFLLSSTGNKGFPLKNGLKTKERDYNIKETMRGTIHF
jgi:hypothetical protein